MASSVICRFCHKMVRDDQDAAKEVSGWVGGPKKDSMRLRRDTGDLAHEHCVTLVMAGQDPTQPDLFTMEHPRTPDRKIADDLEQLL